MTCDSSLILPLLLLVISLCDGLQILDTVQPSCIVKTDKGTLDLSPLATTSDTAPFSASLPVGPGSGTGAIYWNPCNDISPPDCVNDNPSSGELYSLVTSAGIGPVQTECDVAGAKADAKFAAVGDKLQLNYGGDDNPFTVNFTCSEADNTLTLSDDEGSVTFAGKGACFKAAAGTTPHPGGGKGGLSVGSVLLIIVLVLAVVYAVAGISLMKFYKKKEGSEIVPNKEFWISFPGYVKDGVLFVVRRGKPAEKYDNI